MSEKLKPFLDSSSDYSEDTACEILKSLVHSTFVPKLKTSSNQPYHSDDFEGYKQLAEQNFKNLSDALSKMHDKFSCQIDTGWSDIKTDLIVSVILLCSEHMYDELWTTNVTRNSAKELLNNLLTYLEQRSVNELLFTTKKDLIHLLLITLRPKLLKDTWKKYPAAAISYKWIVHCIQVSINLTQYYIIELYMYVHNWNGCT